MRGCEGELFFAKAQDGMPEMLIPYKLYANDFKKRIQRVITDIEDVCYAAEGGKDKDMWSGYTATKFQICRKNLLDLADEVGGMQDNMVFDCVYVGLDDESDEEETKNLFRSIFGKKK